MDDIYKDIEEYKPNRKRKILIVSDDMIVDMLNNIKLNPINELFIWGRKLSIYIKKISIKSDAKKMKYYQISKKVL